MKTSSNSVKELRRRYVEMLCEIYDKEEANTLVMMLLEHHFGINRVALALDPDMFLSDAECLTLQSSMKQLLTNRPIQYVIGSAEFCDMKFSVNENVLIPRPETEELVSMIVDEGQRSTEKIEILDIGTGSGCIAVSLAKLLKNSHVTAIDISEKALEVAKANAIAIANAKTTFIQADILSNPTLPHKFDVIVSNPPYVCESEKAEMHRNVLDFEPAAALFVGDDNPLIFYKQIIKTANEYLKSDGTLWFEINEHLGEETLRLCVENGFANSVIINDFRGKDRFIKAQRKS